MGSYHVVARARRFGHPVFVALQRFALLLLPCAVLLPLMAGCELVSGLSELEKDPEFNPDAETSVLEDTSTTVDSTPSTEDTSTTVPDTGTTPADARPADARPADTSADSGGCGKTGSKTFGGHCYFPLTTNLSFADAKAGCVTEGGYLAIVTSSAENDFIATIDSAAERWIGLSRAAADPNVAASYKWVDGTAFDATKFDGWATGEPNGGDAARLRPTDPKWYDRASATTTAAGIHAICEKN